MTSSITIGEALSNIKAVGFKLDNRTGGEVSGDVGIVQHNFNILSGNYI